MKRVAATYIPLLASAVLLAWSFPGFHLHWLAWVALVPLFVKSADASPGRAALYFFLCGHLFHTVLLQWLFANIFWAGGWALLGQQALCLLLAAFWGLLGFLWTAARAKSHALAGAICVAALWVGMELFVARAFTGFGWAALGYSQGANLIVAQCAAIGGVSLLSFLIVLVNALLALTVVHAELRLKRLAVAAGAVLLAHGAGYLLLEEADYESAPMQAALVQPNFSQEMKWDPAYDYEMLQRTARMTRALAAAHPVDLVVWPEALIVRHFEHPVFMETLANTARDTRAHIFTGAVREEYATSKSYNSSALIDPDGELVGFYDKVHLAPFGEYVPLENYFPFLSQIAFGGVSAGEEQVTFPVNDRVLGPLICFEVLFAPMAEQLRSLGADVLVIITNLAWFGGANAIPQELEIARMRAIETRLPLIHSANTGISGVFDPYGRFSVVRHTVSANDDLLDWGDVVQPRHVIMRRFLDRFPLAAPGWRPLPKGPVWLPWAIVFLGLVLTAAAFIHPLYTSVVEPTPKPKARQKNTKPKTPSKPEKDKTTRKPRQKKKKDEKKTAAQEELPFNAESDNEAQAPPRN